MLNVKPADYVPPTADSAEAFAAVNYHARVAAGLAVSQPGNRDGLTVGLSEDADSAVGYVTESLGRHLTDNEGRFARSVYAAHVVGYQAGLKRAYDVIKGLRAM